MPFTVSHPAVVLPLKHFKPEWFSLTGLMAGAMSPDLLYFLMTITNYRGIGHSWLGLFIFCIPAGIIFSFAFHRLFKYHSIINLPSPLDKVFSGLAVSNFNISGIKQWIVLIISVLIGALSHFAWDSFTHVDGEIVEMIPFLRKETTLFGITRPFCRFIQHASSIIGAATIPFYLIKFKLLPESAVIKFGRKSRDKIIFWFVGCIVALIFVFASVFFYNYILNWHIELGHNRGLALSTIGLASWAGLFYYVCFYSFFNKKTLNRKITKSLEPDN
jgi:hypothetical protein